MNGVVTEEITVKLGIVQEILCQFSVNTKYSDTEKDTFSYLASEVQDCREIILKNETK